MIPLFVDLTGRSVVIFGGGGVAFRKARYFYPDSEVMVVSRSFGKDLSDLPVRKYTADTGLLSDDELENMISSAFLVVATLSDPRQNDRIGKLCRAKGILFNNADGKTGDVIIPSVTSGKNYTIAISTGGDSPAVSRFIREHLESEFPALELMIALQAELREALKGSEPRQEQRNKILKEVLNEKMVWKTLERDPALAREQVMERYIHE